MMHLIIASLFTLKKQGFGQGQNKTRMNRTKLATFKQRQSTQPITTHHVSFVSQTNNSRGKKTPRTSKHQHAHANTSRESDGVERWNAGGDAKQRRRDDAGEGDDGGAAYARQRSPHASVLQAHQQV